MRGGRLPNRHYDAEVLLGYSRISAYLGTPVLWRYLPEDLRAPVLLLDHLLQLLVQRRLAVFQAVKPCAPAGMPHAHNRIMSTGPRGRATQRPSQMRCRRIQSNP